MKEMTQELAAELRKPFPKEVIGKLPKAGLQLDYLGHAAVTDRLLTVDPEWSWEPVASDERGLPAYDDRGGLWIRLTVCGVTRLGYGDGPDPKQRIGDALRNAAMRFGVALDLWTKDELESNLDHEPKNDKPAASKGSWAVSSNNPSAPLAKAPEVMQAISTEQISELMQLAKKKGYTTKESAVAFLNELWSNDFTTVPWDMFAAFKKTVISAGWKKPAATPLEGE